MGCVESTGGEASAPVERVGAKVEVSVQAQGEDVCQHYILGQRIAIGSFGEILRAEHRHTKKVVSVKVLEVGRIFDERLQAASPRATSKSGPQGGISPRGGSIPETDVAVLPRKESKESHASTSIPPRRGSKSSHASHGSFGSTSQTSTASTRASSRGLSSPRGGSKDPLARFDEAVQGEIAVLAELGQHEHVLRFHEFFHAVGICHIIMEYWKENLLQLVDQTVMMDVKELQRLMKEMAAGVNHVHKVGVLHRSIRLESFVLGGEEGKTVKLTDFGSATKMPKGSAPLYDEFGSAAYMSPEMIGDEGYGSGTDIWSLGVTYYRALYGEVPYGATQKAPGKIKAAVLFGSVEPSYKQAEGKQMPLVKDLPQAVEELVRWCLESIPDNRPTAGGIMRHPFLRDMKVQGKMQATPTAGSLTPQEEVAKPPRGRAGN